MRGERSVGLPDMNLFVSCCLFHDCWTGCLFVLTVVSVCVDRVEIFGGSCYKRRGGGRAVADPRVPVGNKVCVEEPFIGTAR